MCLKSSKPTFKMIFEIFICFATKYDNTVCTTALIQEMLLLANVFPSLLSLSQMLDVMSLLIPVWTLESLN